MSRLYMYDVLQIPATWSDLDEPRNRNSEQQKDGWMDKWIGGWMDEENQRNEIGGKRLRRGRNNESESSKCRLQVK